MAEPIRLMLPPRDPREISLARLQDAPREHADALLAAYEVLQGLHERGLLELLRRALGSGDEVLTIAVDAARSPRTIQGIRNLLILTNMLADLDPERLKLLTSAVPASLAALEQESEPPGLLRLATQSMWNKDARRGLSAFIKMLAALGGKLARS
jgi:uncharacterized protein YjgD (DUF1641 family)